MLGIQLLCECECDKSCNVGEYLNYSDCKCRKKLTDKLIHECNETIEETKLVNITFPENENNYECSSFTIFTGIPICLVYYNWYLINNNNNNDNDDDDDDDDDDNHKKIKI